MSLYFITGNAGKFAEAKLHISDLTQLDIDIPEIQELDSKKITKFKLESALNHHKGQFIVDDVSVHLECLNGLPGPLSKWFFQALGVDGIYDVVTKLGNNRAAVSIIIGYAREQDDIHYFEGRIEGKIVKPAGGNGFGWDPVFMPDGFDQTYAQMDPAQKADISHRGIAIKKLKEFLNANRI